MNRYDGNCSTIGLPNSKDFEFLQNEKSFVVLSTIDSTRTLSYNPVTMKLAQKKPAAGIRKTLIVWIHFRRIERDVDFATITEVSRELLKSGYDVQLILPFTDVKVNFGGNSVLYIKTVSGRVMFSLVFMLKLFFHILPFIFSRSSTIILIDYMPFIAFVPLMLLVHTGITTTRFILDIRTIPVEVHDMTDRLKEFYFKMVVLHARHLVQGITVISPFMRQFIGFKYKIPLESMGVWGSGFSEDNFNPRTIKEKINHDEKFVIMYHGILTRNRGLQNVIKAMKQVCKEFPKAIFYILGKGDAVNELKKLIESLSLVQNVIVHDAVPYKKVPLHISRCDVGILPFPYLLWWRVSSPLKLLEYLAMAKPVIVTDIEAHRDVLNSLPCGFFIENNSPANIADAIVKAYKNRKMLPIWGSIGRDRVLKSFTWENQAKRLVHYLKTVT